ncbi:MAG: acyltransferase [Bacteroidales bacterium]|jgi:hypothetical protein|nr:acyltransferase [Bacteroidales bacterium]
MTADWGKRIFEIGTKQQFSALALEAFRYQYEQNEIYGKWCRALGKSPLNVLQTDDIPFLPIEFFKTQKVVSGNWKEETFFKSSGTTGRNSIHHIRSLDFYHRCCEKNFMNAFGNLADYCFIVILPSYAENEHSSLLSMMDFFVAKGAKGSGFFNKQSDKPAQKLIENEAQCVQTILFGVSYALLDLVEQHSFDLKHTYVFETGGMKGRRAEMTKEELHSTLIKGFNTSTICSEYGMCELLSQAYSKGDGIFETPCQMQILLRDENDPLSPSQTSKGTINVIDLANIDSCCFVATADLGEKISDHAFKILGRLNNADIRGCNLLYL